MAEIVNAASPFDHVLIVFAILGHVITFALVAFITSISPPGFGENVIFSFHPFLATLGVIGFISEAIYVFNAKFNFLNLEVARISVKLRVRVHLFFQLFGSLSLAGAFAAIYIHRSNKGKIHFSSWHGLLGLFACSCVWIQFVISLIFIIPNSWFTQFAVLRLLPSFQRIKTIHSFFGLVNYTSLIVVFIFGISTNFFGKSTDYSGAAYYVALALAIVLGGMVFIQAGSSVIRKMRYWNVGKSRNATNEFELALQETNSQE